METYQLEIRTYYRSAPGAIVTLQRLQLIPGVREFSYSPETQAFSFSTANGDHDRKLVPGTSVTVRLGDEIVNEVQMRFEESPA